MNDAYMVDEAHGDNWSLLLGDSCERLAEIPDESVDLSICSPPFASLFTYSPSVRDLGNSGDRIEFLQHYEFIIEHQLRVTKPGRLACVHVQQIATKKAVDGYIGLTDFRGDVIRAFQKAGWIYNGEVTVWKDPQAQSIRTKSHQLAFTSKNRDSSKIRPALADYLLLFRKPGDNAEPIKHEANDGELTNDDWIDWASPIWNDIHDGGWLTDDGGHICPTWWGIKETKTLNTRVAKESADERHICPLQLEFIERCVRLWSNPGDLVLTPFAGIGSELFESVRLGRRAIGVELKPSYWATAVDNLRRLESDMAVPSLFDEEKL